MATLGRALVRRGHRVTIFQIPGMRESIERQQLEFRPLGWQSSRSAELAEAVLELGRRSGLSALRFTLDCGRRLASVVCEYGPEAVRAAGIDLLIVDDNEPAGGSVAQHLNLPFVNLGLIPLHREKAVPPPFVPWTYRGGRLPALRNSLAYTVFERLVAPTQKVINGYRSQWKLSQIKRPQDTLSPYAQLSQLIAEFDFPRTRKPECLQYLGALLDNQRPPVTFPFNRLNGKALIYASLGTLQNNRPEYFQAIAKACEPLNVQLVISTGGRDVQALDLPSSVIAVPYAPQLSLLSRASLCVTHAGLNTVMECLRFGLPMVCIPVTNDQPAVAARVQWTGAGEVIPLAKLTANNLRAAVQRVLDEPEFRAAAHSLAPAVQDAGGVERGADIVLQVLNTSKPVCALRPGLSAGDATHSIGTVPAPLTVEKA